MRQAKIYRKDIFAGILTEDGGEYRALRGTVAVLEDI